MIKYILFFLPLLLPAKELSIYTFGLSYHGRQIGDRETAAKIPHKIDSGGNLTYHPELSVMYSDNFVYGFTYLKNTFYNDAFMLTVGKTHQAFEYTQVGLLGSIYMYQRESGVLEPALHQTKSHGFLFFPWFFVKQDIPVNPKANVSLILTTNGFLSHLAFGTTIKL